jgi:succinate-semialdehyde dehydrogenase/glutarate-semialdehyde dehydrogenase
MPFQLYIGGSWRDGAEKAQRDIINPASGEVVARAAVGNERDGRAAMDAAAAALAGWSARTAYDRAGYLVEAARIVRARTDEIARVLTQENGKPLAESVAETAGCAGWLEWYAEEGKRIYGRMVPSHYRQKRHWVLKQPIGVVASITPWNFPVSLMIRKLSPALASGCTIVCRSASETPLSAMMMFECLHEAGLPAGTANLVTGPPEPLARALQEHPSCRKLAFTGSTDVGKQLMQKAGERITKVSLELGGHAPLVVFADVDLA